MIGRYSGWGREKDKKQRKEQKDGKYLWTHHSQFKMRQYALSESRLKRVIRYPDRVEKSIVPGLVAAMQITRTAKRRYEVWIMYEVGGGKQQTTSGRPRTDKKIRIISAWKYPGESPARDPIPKEILEEIRSISAEY